MKKLIMSLAVCLLAVCMPQIVHAQEKNYVTINASGSNLTEKIQEALDDNTVITVPKGTYKMQDTIKLNGQENVTIDFSGSKVSGTTFFTFYSGKNITIKGGVFTGKKTSYGVKIYGGQNITLSSMTIEKCDNAIRAWDGTFNLKSVVVKKSYHVGMSIYGSKTTCTITKGKFNSNGTRPDKTENAPDSHAAGIGVFEGATLVAKNVTISSNHGSGIVLDGRTGSKKPTAKIYGCAVKSNGDHGIAANPKGVVIIGKTGSGKSAKYTVVEKNKTDGVMLMNGSQGKTISYLKSQKNGRDGLAVSYNSTCKEISNCIISGNKRNGLILFDKGVVNTIQKCEISNNQWVGLALVDKSTVKKLQNNTIKKNKVAGVQLSNGSKVNAGKKNTVKGNATNYLIDSTCKYKAK